MYICKLIAKYAKDYMYNKVYTFLNIVMVGGWWETRLSFLYPVSLLY